jgi:hypothetical protein
VSLTSQKKHIAQPICLHFARAFDTVALLLEKDRTYFCLMCALFVYVLFFYLRRVVGVHPQVLSDFARG